MLCYKQVTESMQTGHKRVLFDAVKDGEALAPRVVAPESEQEPYESRRYKTGHISLPSLILYRLWSDLTKAILAKDMDAATTAKGAVEDAQRDKRKADDPSKHAPRFFSHKDGHWEPKFTCVGFCDSFLCYSFCVKDS